VAEDGVGTTRGSLEVSCDIENPPNNCCALSCAAVPGAVRYRIYKKGDLPGEQYDKYHTSLTNSYDYKTDSGAASAPEGVPEVTTAYANKFSADSPSWILNGNVGIGTVNPASTLDVKGPISGFGIVPIGSIIAWHKSFPSTPALPDGWVECNGQTLNDPASAYHGQMIPNLNGESLFLRGANLSGTMQEDQMQSHTHIDSGHDHTASTDSDGTHNHHMPAVVKDTGGNYGVPVSGLGGLGLTWPGFNGTPTPQTTNNGAHTHGIPTDNAVLGDPEASTQGTSRHGAETRPKNMSVVWIMRIK